MMKMVVYAVSMSPSMLAEFLHSLLDTANQVCSIPIYLINKHIIHVEMLTNTVSSALWCNEILFICRE